MSSITRSFAVAVVHRTGASGQQLEDPEKRSIRYGVAAASKELDLDRALTDLVVCRIRSRQRAVLPEFDRMLAPLNGR